MAAGKLRLWKKITRLRITIDCCITLPYYCPVSGNVMFSGILNNSHGLT